jgi:tetratricopeptide (TPR) repeat protein
LPGRWSRWWYAAIVAAGLPLASLSAELITPEDFLQRAEEHLQRRRFLNALESLRTVLQMTENRDARKYQTKLIAEVLAAESLSELGRFDEAANMFERAEKHGYHDKKVLVFLAKYFDRKKNWDKAQAYYEQYYGIDKADTAMHIRYAVLMGRLRQRPKAKKILEDSEPKSAAQDNEQCEKLESRRKLKPALECFRGLQQAQPDREKHYLALYRIAVKLHDNELISDTAEQLYYIFGDQPRYVWPLVEVKIVQKKFYSARILLEEIVAIEGPNSDAQRQLANLQNAIPQALDRPNGATPKELRFLNKDVIY